MDATGILTDPVERSPPGAPGIHVHAAEQASGPSVDTSALALAMGVRRSKEIA
jgi:hypothetical protein